MTHYVTPHADSLPRSLLLAAAGILLTSSALLAADTASPAPTDSVPKDITALEAREVPVTAAPDPLKLADADLQWWREARFGIFVHWGLYSILGRSEWALFKEQIDCEEYARLAEKFTAERYDAGEWARTARAAGARYMVMVSRHHDGFALWDSPASYQRFDSMHSAARRDLVAEYAKACRAEGLRVGVYYSPLDWRFPGYFFPAMYRRSAEELRDQGYAQVRELLTRFGRIDVLWYDGGGDDWLALGGMSFDRNGWKSRPRGTKYAGRPVWEPEKLNAMVRELQPKVVINNRSGWPGDFESRERGVGEFDDRRPWEKCSVLAGSWGWQTGRTAPRSLEVVLKELSAVVCRDGNYLLNVGPRADGEIEPAQVERLREIGAWLEKYGRCIYGTRGGPLRPTEEFGMTRRGDTVYVHVWKWPADGCLRLEGLSLNLKRGSALCGGEVRVNVVDGDVTIERQGGASSGPLCVVELKP